MTIYGSTLPGTRRLFIIGGSPLTNDVWAGDIVQDASGSWSFVWEEMASGDNVPFSPRAGLGKQGQRPTSPPQPYKVVVYSSAMGALSAMYV